uniref:uncharacterized protein LOC120328808 n=1 Tax=Styela clava TaxID=7725 RepID=UPI00193AD76B|nr:uncharacterized protein LOC120328808 [Styela clava]
MFQRVQKWVRGKDKKLSEGSGVKHSNKKGRRPKYSGQSQERTVSCDGEPRNVNGFEDEFKPHDIDGFDIVPTTIASKDEQSNLLGDKNLQQEPSVNSSNQQSSEDIFTSFTKTEIPEDNSDSKLPNGEIEPKTLFEQSEQMENNTNSNLSIDEKEILDMFDSIVNDFENESDTEEKYGGVDEENEAINGIGHINNVENNESESNESPNVQNWKMTGLIRQKSLRFVSKEDMYLPSPENERRNNSTTEVPELPPADYPVSEDDIDDDEESEQSDSETLEKSNEKCFKETITSFSSQPLKKEIQESNFKKTATTNVTNQGTELSDCSPRTNGYKENAEKYKNSWSSESESSEKYFSTSPDVPRSAPAQPRRPRPRVTSFKSAALPKLSSKPVNDLVKKFEDYKTGDTF